MDMFDRASNVQLGSKLLKYHYHTFISMHCVEHNVSLLFNGVFKISILNHMIAAHKVIYNVFGSIIYHKPHSRSKYKSQLFQNVNIGLYSVNDDGMAKYSMGMHRYLHIKIFFIIPYCLHNSSI